MIKLTTTIDIELLTHTVLDKARILNATNCEVLYLSPAVAWFAIQMEHKLQTHKERRDSFKECSINELLKMLDVERRELQTAFMSNDTQGEVVLEAADVANFAMFIAINRMIEKGEAA